MTKKTDGLRRALNTHLNPLAAGVWLILVLALFSALQPWAAFSAAPEPVAALMLPNDSQLLSNARQVLVRLNDDGSTGAMPGPSGLTALLPATIGVQPSRQTVSVGQRFTVTVAISDAVDLGAFEFTLAYSPTVLEVVTATLGSFLGSTGRNVVPFPPAINPAAGTLNFGAYSLGSTPQGPTGNGPLAVLTLRALKEGESNLDFTAAQVANREGTAQPVAYLSGHIIVIVRPAERTYRATWLSHHTPVTMMMSETKKGITVTVRNDSNWTWPYTGTNPVRLGYHWLNSAGQTVLFDGLRACLPNDLPPAQTVEFSATVKAPDSPGTYTLVWDMVEELVTWFQQRGSPILSVSVAVQPRTYRATWLSLNTPTTLRADERVTATVAVRNDSNWTWPYTGTNPVRLGYHWLNSNGQMVVFDGLRARLPNDLPPSQTAELSAPVKAPDSPGTYILVWDMVEEGVTWFEWRGSPTTSVSVHSQPRTYRATWLGLNTPVTLSAGELATATVTVRNDSTWTWPHTGPKAVRLSYHWLSNSGQPVLWDGRRAVLSGDLQPGQIAELNARVKALDIPGTYFLVWDMVEEGVTWFQWQGSPTVSVSIHVKSPTGSVQLGDLEATGVGIVDLQPTGRPAE